LPRSGGYLPQIRDGRIERAQRESLGRDHLGQSPSREQEHLVGDLASLGDDRPETHAGEDEHVVGWPMTWVMPPRVTASNGLRSRRELAVRPGQDVLGVASVFAVGFESGKMTGRSAWAAISRIAASVNAPARRSCR